MSYHRTPKSAYFVYFARAGEMVKIGCSTQPQERLCQIAEWVPFNVQLVATVPGAFDLEADLHAFFAADWSHLEWFHVSPAMEALIEDIQAGREISIPRQPRDAGKELHKTLKKRATHRIRMADKRAGRSRNCFERRALWPDYLRAAVASFDGSHAAPPSPAALAAIARYEAEMALESA